MATTGRCLCGAVRFSFAGPPLAKRACWCRDCQYLSSGNASINVIFATAGFTVAGDLGEYRSTADSGHAMRRRFCRSCGTPLFSEDLGEPAYMVVRAGALDDPAIGRPEGTIWTASAPPWGHVDPDLPNSPRQRPGAPASPTPR